MYVFDDEVRNEFACVRAVEKDIAGFIVNEVHELVVLLVDSDR